MTGPRIEPSFFESIFGLQPQQSAPPPPQPSPTDRLFQALSGINAAIRQAMVPSGLAQLESGAKQFGEQQGYQFEAQRAQAGYAKSHPQSTRAQQEMMNNAVMMALGMVKPAGRTVGGHVAALRSIGEHAAAENLEHFMARSKIRQPVYHGTARNFDAFDPKQIGSGSGTPEEGAFFFSTEPDVATHYATVQGGNYVEHFAGTGKASNRADHYGAVMPVYLRAENPYVSKLKVYNSKDVAAEVKKAKKLGHDSIVFPEITYDNERGQIAVFSPEQIKSATGNSGTFDPKKASILASLLLAILAGPKDDQK